MQGKRFGVGIAGGLLLGLLVVAASIGPLGVLTSSPNSLQPAASGGSTSTSTTSSSSEGQGANYGVNSSKGGVPSSVTTTTTVQTGSSSPANGGSSGQYMPETPGGGHPPTASSLSSLAPQSPALYLLVVLPILCALALGAIFYRGSGRGQSEKKESEDAGPT